MESAENVDRNSQIVYDDDQERAHFQRIINAFKFYRTYSLQRLAKSDTCFKRLPARHRGMLPHFTQKLARIRACIAQNATIIEHIVANTQHMFENTQHSPATDSALSPATDLELSKVKSTLKQFVRDWSIVGEAERNATYKPVIDEILRRLPADNSGDRSHLAVLVPGAGLGRLAFEIARLGYTCEGNEFSLFMLFASNFVLNKCVQVDSFTLYPWAHQYCNNWLSADQLQPITFPDTNPSKLSTNGCFSMAAGDFLEVYKEPDRWDCVATVFFIDTAHNVVQYIETIANILKPGGYWINLGPLLYHFAETEGEDSIELSYEELREVIVQFDLEIIEERRDIRTGYTQNERSMLTYEYKCVFFVAQKRLEAR